MHMYIVNVYVFSYTSIRIHLQERKTPFLEEGATFFQKALHIYQLLIDSISFPLNIFTANPFPGPFLNLYSCI